MKITRFLNHLSHADEVHLGIEALKKMGFTSHLARTHIKHLEAMGLVMSGGYCPVAGVSKSYRLLPLARQFFADQAQDESSDDHEMD